MEDLVLKKVAIEYCDRIFSYKDEFIYNNESIDGTGFLRNTNSPQEYIEKSLLNETEEVDGRKVTATQLLAIRKSDNCIVGMIQIRHFLNDYLLQYGGHIGYSIRKSERKKGYAKEELRQALESKNFQFLLRPRRSLHKLEVYVCYFTRTQGYRFSTRVSWLVKPYIRVKLFY